MNLMLSFFSFETFNWEFLGPMWEKYIVFFRSGMGPPLGPNFERKETLLPIALTRYCFGYWDKWNSLKTLCMCIFVC